MPSNEETERRAEVSAIGRQAPGREPRRYEFVDALRGIAVLGVVAVHTTQNFHARAIESLLGLGQYGVQLFYIVSAFSLCLSLDQRSRSERRPILNYGLRRFFRIAPMFYVAMIAYLLKPYLLPASAIPVDVNPGTWSLQAWHVAATLLFVNGWHYESINLIVPGGWSVAVETNFYLVLPFIYRYATSLKRALLLFAATLIGAVVLRKCLFLLWAPHVPAHEAQAFNVFSSMCLPSQLPVFALGIVMFRTFRLLESARLSPQQQQQRSRWFEASVAALIVTAAVESVLPRLAGKIIAEQVQVAIVLFLFTLVLAQRPARLFVNRASVFLGRISYSVYLTHFIALHLVIWASRGLYEPRFHRSLPFLGAFALVLALTVLASTVTYHLVELPGQELGRRLIRRLEAAGKNPT